MGRSMRLPRRSSSAAPVVLAAAAAVAAVAATAGCFSAVGQPRGGRAPPTARRNGLLGAAAGLLLGGGTGGNEARALTKEERHVASMFLQSAPSVLGLTDASLARRRISNEAPPPLSGSGFVWDKTHVVTNYHVLDEMKNPQVVFATKDSSGKERHSTLGATIVGADPLSDIAVLEVNAEGQDIGDLMRPLRRATSNQARPGQDVYALGNPLGLEHSMSKGVISGVSRTMEGVLGRPIRNIIQTDASINPGNSGGPLLNSDGAVIGVNSAILSTTGMFGGVGLAIPIDTVEHNVASMISNGYVSRSSLGVVFAPAYLSEVLGVNDGAMVMKVFSGSPAQKAGIQAMRKGRLGDVIIGMAGNPVASTEDVFKILDQRSPGEDLTMQLRRASRKVDSDEFDYVDIKVRLGSSNSKLVAT